jgi:hypothetical protein
MNNARVVNEFQVHVHVLCLGVKMKPDFERVTKLLTDTVTLLCKNGLTYNQDLHIQGLLGITVDSTEVFLVSLNERCRLSGTPSSSAVSSSGRDSASLEREPARKRPREDVVDLTRVAEVPDTRAIPASSRAPPNLSPVSVVADTRPRSAGLPQPSQSVYPSRSHGAANRMHPPPHVSPRGHQASASAVSQRQVASSMARGGPVIEQQSIAAADSSRMMTAAEHNMIANQRVEQQQQMIIANSLQRLTTCADNPQLKHQQQMHHHHQQQQQQQQQLAHSQQLQQQQQTLQHQQQALQQHQLQLQQQQAAAASNSSSSSNNNSNNNNICSSSNDSYICRGSSKI